jgi:hypothetical protein
MQTIDHNIGFQEKTLFFRKLGKIAENCDHNIDPKTFSVEKSTPNFGFHLYFSQTLPKKKIAKLAEIHPIWSPCLPASFHCRKNIAKTKLLMQSRSIIDTKLDSFSSVDRVTRLGEFSPIG